MERPPKKYVCEKCGYLGDTSEHEGCDYLACTTGEQLCIYQLEREFALLKASPASAPEGFKHDIGADRFTVVQGSYWWHVRAGEGTQNIGKFHTKRAAEEMALTLLTAFRDGAFIQYQAMLATAPTPPVSESVDPVMTKEELIAAAESIGMRFPGASIPPVSEDRWLPIATAPKDRFVLLAGPSGYTTIETVFATGRMCSDYHVGRWIDHANDDLTDWGFEPTHWMPLPKAPTMQEDKKP